MIEGKFTEEEALSQSYDMLSAGIDTVNTRVVNVITLLGRAKFLKLKILYK